MCAMGVLLSAAAAALADGGWLDASPLVSWNPPGADIPVAPATSGAVDPRCARLDRPAETAEDAAVAAAGWTLFGSYQSGWGVRLVYGRTGQDGMCRPLGYQEFVFVNGVFAGTISPAPMDARTDGAESTTLITGPGDSLQAQFARYARTDPLCCPSRVSSVEYHLKQDSGAPVLEPGSVYTASGGT